MPKLTEYQYTYKKSVGFTLQQKEAFKKLKDYNVNVNQFIRSAINEKLKRDWKSIKEKNTVKCPF
tara:strand:- start:31 stop:225 length:195 start_codon:yes stop_codon:yes gene_type:complete